MNELRRAAFSIAAVAAGASCSSNHNANTSATGVLELHGSASRAGAYVVPSLTQAAAAGLHMDSTFTATYSGNAYAQPLYYDVGGPGDLVIAASEMNEVTAFNPTGQMVWQRDLGTPQPMPNPDEGAPCGDINPLGITGTPVIDPATRTLYLDAMISDGGAHHRIFALSLDDGSTLAGWPVDAGTTVTSGAMAFEPAVENQRGGLTLLNGDLYVPYGGHAGDCGDYHGWVVSVPESDPTHPTGWATAATQAGAWSPGGVSSDGTNVFAVFGNGTNDNGTWENTEMLGRFGAGATFSGDPADYWVPTNWLGLDQSDIDTTGPALVVDLPDSTPSALLVSFGKDGTTYVTDRNDLGGISAPVAELQASTAEIINVSATYQTALGTYVVFRGGGMDGCPNMPSGANLVALLLSPGSPPQLSVAWCAGTGPVGSPIATTTDGTSEPIVWAIGAEGDQRLHGYDGDTGATVFDGGGDGDAMTSTSRFITPMVANGRIFVAADGQLYAFTTD
jgi:hypothetical protein